MKVVATEHALELTFTDGSNINIHGHRWEDCSLGVDVMEKT